MNKDKPVSYQVPDFQNMIIGRKWAKKRLI